jgi:hypothetical protein
VPLIPILASVLKVSRFSVDIVMSEHTDQTSTALEMARTVGRIALTFVPFLLFSNHRSRRWLRRAEAYASKEGNKGPWEEKKTIETNRIKMRTGVLHVLLLFPISLFFVTILASLERTPLTGRCVNPCIAT